MEKKRSSSRRDVAAEAEEKVWAGFYRSVADSDIAAELIAHMDKDADCRQRYPGLYLRCKQSVRRQRLRQARSQRLASIARMILRAVFLTPALAAAWLVRGGMSLARFGGNVALDMCDGGAAVPPTVSKPRVPSRAKIRPVPAAKAEPAPAAKSNDDIKSA